MRYINVTLGKANPERQNGVNFVVHNLAAAEQRLGVSVEVWGLTKDTDSSTSSRSYPLRLFKNAGRLSRLSPDLKNALFGLTPQDVVHFHGSLILQFYLISRILRKIGVPWIITPHGALNDRSISKNRLIKQAYIALFEASVLENSMCVHVYARSEIESMAKHIVPGRILVLPNGSNAPETTLLPTSRSAYPVFGYIGRLAIPQKGLDLLLEGFAQYKNSGGLGVLRIVGGGSELSKLDALAKRFNISSVVQFLGARYGAEKNSALAGFDVFLHTSRWEGMPVSVLEAAASGKPLIVSRETNLSTYVQSWNAGYVLADLSPTSVCVALKEAEKDFHTSALIEKGKAAAAMAAGEFNWDSIAAALVDYVTNVNIIS